MVPEELAAGGHDETQLQDEQIVACSTHRGKRTWHGQGSRGRSVGVGLYVSLVIGMLGGICVHECAAQSAGINK